MQEYIGVNKGPDINQNPTDFLVVGQKVRCLFKFSYVVFATMALELLLTTRALIFLAEAAAATRITPSKMELVCMSDLQCPSDTWTQIPYCDVLGDAGS